MNKDSYKIIAAPLYFIAAALFDIGSTMQNTNNTFIVMYIMMIILAWYHVASRDNN